ncbi:hypothetical protein F5888DRAFT_1741582 [Russula emetica]|nr:hypothetical protein F5888DRAFT_1741582 [Russula emetica]
MRDVMMQAKREQPQACHGDGSVDRVPGLPARGDYLGYASEQSPHIASIHILNDDSFLNIFYLPPIFDGDEDEGVRLAGGRESYRERWCYNLALAHVCQRWRNLILGSTSYLGLCLVCTFGTPVADMLAHSPPLPLIIDQGRNVTEDEEGIVLALEQRDRVRRVRL